LLSEECCIVIVILALVSATDVAAINLIIRKYAGENKVRGSGYRGWGIAAETSNEKLQHTVIGDINRIKMWSNLSLDVNTRFNNLLNE